MRDLDTGAKRTTGSLVRGSLVTLAFSLALVALLSAGLSFAGLANDGTIGDGTSRPVSQDGNLIANPSFEANLDGWRIGTTAGDDWNPSWQQSSAQRWDGNASALVLVEQNEITEPALSYFEYQTAPVVVGGQPYTFTALSRTTNPNFVPILRIAWFDAAGTYLGEENEPIDPSQPPNAWIVHEYHVVPPPDAAIAYLRLVISVYQAGITGSTWWDAVHFAPDVDLATPVASPAATPIAGTDASPIQQFLATTLNAPDASAISRFVAPEAQFTLGSGPSLDAAGFITNREQFHDAYADAAYRIDATVGEGSNLAARWTFRATERASGRAVAMTGMSLLRLDGDRIVDYREVADRYGLGHRTSAIDQSSAVPSPVGDTDPVAAKALVRGWYEQGWNERNLALVNLIFSPNFVDHASEPSDALAPRCGEFGGCRAGIKQLVFSNVCGFPNLLFTIDEQIAGGDTVVTRWTLRGTHGGDFAGIPATGGDIAVTGITFDRVADGAIVESWGVSDLSTLLAQLGAGNDPPREPGSVPIPGLPTTAMGIGVDSFEDGLVGWTADASNPANWNPTWAISTQDAVDGSASAAVTVTEGDAINSVSYLQSCPIAVEPNRQYVFTASSNASTAGHLPILQVIWHDADGEYIGGAAENAVTPVETDRWLPHRLAVTAPANAAAVSLRLQIGTPTSTAGLVNPSFERDTNGWSQGTANPTTWNPTWSRATGVAADGIASAQVAVSRNEIPEPSTSYYEYRVSGIVPGETYRFSAASRTTEPAFSPSLGVVWFDASGNAIGQADESQAPASKTDGWTEHLLETAAPSGATVAALRIRISVAAPGVTGQTWWDDLQFTSKSGAPTDQTPPSINVSGTTLWDDVKFDPIS